MMTTTEYSVNSPPARGKVGVYYSGVYASTCVFSLKINTIRRRSIAKLHLNRISARESIDRFDRKVQAQRTLIERTTQMLAKLPRVHPVLTDRTERLEYIRTAVRLRKDLRLQEHLLKRWIEFHERSLAYFELVDAEIRDRERRAQQ